MERCGRGAEGLELRHGGSASFLNGEGDSYGLFLLCERCCCSKNKQKIQFQTRESKWGAQGAPQACFFLS